jgi:spermidine synthase
MQGWLWICLLLLAPLLGEGDVYSCQSAWNSIVVEQRQGIRTLRFGQTVQSRYDLNHPQRLVVAYTRLAMVALPCVPRPQRVLLVGLGGGSMAKYLHRTLPDCQIEAVDLDPEVLRVARQYFDVPQDPRLHLIAAEGRGFLEQTPHRYDLIFLDAYGDANIPLGLASQEFLELVKSRLDPHGAVVSNLWGQPINPLFLDMVHTYRAVFSEVHCIHAAPDPNQIVLAFPSTPHLTRQSLADLASSLPGLGDLRGDVLRGYQVPPSGRVLHDD